jgi:hypothetical protein
VLTFTPKHTRSHKTKDQRLGYTTARRLETLQLWKRNPVYRYSQFRIYVTNHMRTHAYQQRMKRICCSRHGTTHNMYFNNWKIKTRKYIVAYCVPSIDADLEVPAVRQLAFHTSTWTFSATYVPSWYCVQNKYSFNSETAKTNLETHRVTLLRTVDNTFCIQENYLPVLWLPWWLRRKFLQFCTQIHSQYNIARLCCMASATGRHHHGVIDYMITQHYERELISSREISGLMSKHTGTQSIVHR